MLAMIVSIPGRALADICLYLNASPRANHIVPTPSNRDSSNSVRKWESISVSTTAKASDSKCDVVE